MPIEYSAMGAGSRTNAPVALAIGFFLMAFFALPAAAGQSQLEYCSLLSKCGIPRPAGSCPDSLSQGVPEVKYDAERCGEAREMYKRGVSPSDPGYGYRLYRNLGERFRVVYTVEESIPISEARLGFLLNDLPLAARLLSHYQKEKYEAEYLDSPTNRNFKGKKGDNLTGRAWLLTGSTGERRLYYHGFGVAQVAWWRLRGYAFMDFQFRHDPKDPKKLNYTLKILVFPGNSVVNVIMNLGMFRNIALGKVKEVLTDITGASHKLALDGGKEILKNASWNTAEKKSIEKLLALP